MSPPLYLLKVAALFLDLSSAFDTIGHELLLEKLEYYGIRGNVLGLFRSYLHNRKMFIEIKSINNDSMSEIATKSKMVDIKVGVPQGSILGPILFIIYINDFIQHVKNTNDSIKLILFADDTNAVISDNNLESLDISVNQALETMSDWLTANGLRINTSKTNAMLYRNNARNKDILNATLNGNVVQMVQVTRFLGVNIDETLKWKHELDDIENRISSACYVLRSLRDEADVKHLKLVYYALVESRLRYSILFWGRSYQYNIHTAFVQQKRAIRTMVRIRQQDSCREHFKRLGILTVPSLYILVLLTHFAKHISDYETPDERIIRECTRRQDFNNTCIPHLNIVKQSSFYQSVAIFNRLPIGLKSLVYKSSFKTVLKHLLLEGCYYSVDEFINNFRNNDIRI